VIACHTSDQHLGPAGSRLDSETGLNGALMDRYRAARFCVKDSIARGAQVILSAGDLFDGYKPTPTVVRLARQVFEPAQAAGVPIVLLKGNHDDVRSPIEQHALDLLRDMKGVTVVDRPCLLNVWECLGMALSDPSTYHVYPVDEPQPGPIIATSLALQIAALPYPNRQLLLQSEEARGLSPADLNQVVRERMMDCARDLAAQRVEDVPAVLLGHFAVDTAAAGKQNSLAMLSGEFTLNVYDLEALGFDGVYAGHYHRRQVLLDDPWIGYCGSPEATSFGEEADGDKGYYLHEIGGHDVN